MEASTGKRQYRKRAPVAAPEVGGQAAGEPADAPGHRKDGETGDGAQGEIAAPTRQGNDDGPVVVTLGQLHAAVATEQRQVVRLWHPEADGTHHSLGNGVNAELHHGEAAYQVSDGTIIKDF